MALSKKAFLFRLMHLVIIVIVVILLALLVQNGWDISAAAKTMLGFFGN